MSFNSITFLFLFLPATVLLYYLFYFLRIPKKEKVLNALLVAFSFVFFLWAGTETVISLISIVLWNYLFGLLSIKHKKWALPGVVGNIGIFCYFKVYNAFLQLLNDLFLSHLTIEKIIFPIGISFIMFHGISYLLDIYHDKAKPNKNIIDFTLFITFFPKLVQGPIVKYYEFEPFLRERKIGFNDLVEGLERFIIGLAKKVLMADILALKVNDIFAMTYETMDVGTAWLGSVLFTLQIYLDFSGYSDMAIGLARIFGFRFSENFHFPYSSTSISEFWRRWHISLGAWFREYLYIPLGGSRKGNVYFNLFVVFLVTGIWHGASIVFILWGLCHGLCVIIERFLNQKGWFERIPKALRWCYTMLVVNIGWIVFKVSDFDMFKTYVKHLLGLEFDPETLLFSASYWLTDGVLLVSLLAIFCMILLQNKKVQEKLIEINGKSLIFNALKYVILLILFAISVSAIISSSYSPFLYFQF